MNRWLLCLGLALSAWTQAGVAVAHPGGLDKHGCHHQRGGGYHCHGGGGGGGGFTPSRRSTPTPTSEPKKAEEKEKAPPPAAPTPSPRRHITPKEVKEAVSWASFQLEDVRSNVEPIVEEIAVERQRKLNQSRIEREAEAKARERASWWVLWITEPNNKHIANGIASLLIFASAAGAIIALVVMVNRSNRKINEKKKAAWLAKVSTLDLDDDLKLALEPLTFTTYEVKNTRISQALAAQAQRRMVAAQRAADEAAQAEAHAKAEAARAAREATKSQIAEELRQRGIEGDADAVWGLYALRVALTDTKVPDSDTLDLVADVAKHRGVYLDMTPAHVEVMHGPPDHSPLKVMKTKTKQTYTYYDQSGRITSKFEFEDGKLVEYQI